MFWLDWLLFGNGFGMASPRLDDVFYWLHDAYTEDGHFYRYFGGLGAQLTSCEWSAPRPGTQRKLFKHDFVVHSSLRRGPRVEVSWALAKEFKVTDLKTLHEELKNWGHGL